MPGETSGLRLLRGLRSDDLQGLEEAARLLAKVFHSRAAWKACGHLLTGTDDPADVEKTLLEIMRCYLFLTTLENGMTFNRVLDEQDQVIACFCVTDMRSEPTNWQKLQAGMLSLLWKLGISNLLLFHELAQFYEDGCRRYGGQGGKFYLIERMAVSEEFHGRGIASRFFAEALATLEPLPVLLSTQEERNARFYEKLGFKILSSERNPILPEIPNFFMRREALTSKEACDKLDKMKI